MVGKDLVFCFFEQAKMKLYYENHSNLSAQGVPKRPLPKYKEPMSE
jgi:hypothetical protein